MLSLLPSNISFYIILTLSILLAVVSTISVKLYRSKVEAESALVVAIDANTEMVKAANLQKMSCDLTDKLLSDLQSEKNSLDAQKNSTLDKLNNIPSKSVKTPSSSVKTNESNVADIDDSLPSSLIILLKSSSGEDKNSVDVHP